MHTYHVYTHICTCIIQYVHIRTYTRICIQMNFVPCTYKCTYVCMIHIAPTKGVACSQWEWHLYSGSGISTVGVASLQWEWRLYIGSGISTVGVANSRYGTIHSLALRPVPYLQLHMHSDPQYITPDNPLK